MEKLEKKGDMAKEVTENPDLLPKLFKGICAKNPTIKFSSAKTLIAISERNPKRLYSEMNFFVNLLDSENRILKWTAMDVIGNLASVDSENKFDIIFKKYYGFLSADSMITIGHVVDNSGKIAKAKSSLTEKITRELLKMEKISVKPPLTQECKNILLGKAILAFDAYFDQIGNKDDVISFVKRQLNNTRNATKVKAEKFLKKRS